MSQYVVCNVPDCSTDGYPSDMEQVRVIFDGVPIVGVACSPEHTQQLRRNWESADRFEPPTHTWLAGVTC